MKQFLLILGLALGMNVVLNLADRTGLIFKKGSVSRYVPQTCDLSNTFTTDKFIQNIAIFDEFFFMYRETSSGAPNIGNYPVDSRSLSSSMSCSHIRAIYEYSSFVS